MSGKSVMKANKKQRKGNLISVFLICNLFSCFIFLFVIDSAKGAGSHTANIQQEPTYIRCQWALSTPQLHSFNRVILQVSSILDILPNPANILPNQKTHINLTDTTLDAIKKMRSIVKRWMSKDRVFPVGTFLQIAYFLGIEPAVLLSAQNLQEKVHINGLTQRSFMSDTALQNHLRDINQALREHISESVFQFSLQFKNPDFDLSDLAITIGVPIEDLDQINSSHFVPHYLQMERILNAGNNDRIKVSVVDFFRKIRKKEEASENLDTSQQTMSQEEEPLD